MRSALARLLQHPSRLAWPSLACLGLAGLARLERFVWVGALSAELGFHVLLVALGLALVAAVRRDLLAGAAALLAAALLALPLVPLYRSTRPTPPAGPVLHVSTAHACGLELTPVALAVFLERSPLDLAVITGARASDLRALGPRLRGYRVAHGDLSQAQGLALLIREAVLAAPPKVEAADSLGARVRAGTCELQVRALDLPALTSFGGLGERARASRELGAASPGRRGLWLGFLGSRPEAADLDALRRAQGLRDARAGHGRLPTAPGGLGALGLPWSHLLLHGWMRVPQLSTGEPIVPGAHRSLRADVELTEPRCRGVRPGTQ